jgi:serine/threonine protein kinase
VETRRHAAGSFSTVAGSPAMSWALRIRSSLALVAAHQGRIGCGETVASRHLAEVDGATCISMEYVDGEDLGGLLRRIGRLPGDKGIEIARKLCAGLAAAHAKGVLHRDLKPSNIMIDGRGQVLIMDFGLAAIADQVEGAEVRNGTPAYMAPEQLAGREVTERSDIYALGLVLYEIFTGQRAFTKADRKVTPAPRAQSRISTR